MNMNEAQRADLAARIKAVRLRRYKGNRKAAYAAAEVNSNTWTRAEAGETLAERSLVAIIQTLWPETGGDWAQLDPPLGGGTRPLEDVEAEVRSWGLDPAAEADILETVAADYAKRPQDQQKRRSAG